MAHSSPSLAARCVPGGPAVFSTGFGMRSALGMQRGLCSFQWALWQSLLQYLTRPQREQLDMVGSWRSQWAQVPASSLEAGFFFVGGMALGGEEKRARGLGTPATPDRDFLPLKIFEVLLS